MYFIKFHRISLTQSKIKSILQERSALPNSDLDHPFLSGWKLVTFVHVIPIQAVTGKLVKNISGIYHALMYFEHMYLFKILIWK